MVREKAQGQQSEAESTNALIRVGLLHSSDEGPVMGLERREQVIEIALGQPKGRSLTMQWGDGIPRDGTSRKMREYQIRFCEKLSVKFTGLTRQFPGPTRRCCFRTKRPGSGILRTSSSASRTGVTTIRLTASAKPSGTRAPPTIRVTAGLVSQIRYLLPQHHGASARADGSFPD
jgi:hypothetical protein